ncbi:protocatechuate 3,4-dioxygenase [Pseudoalteromonas obscura]|uniref:Protocatechuate 3,4-dioxygenase n=1 Tax=Pseudoalteromonas obscura TaxID=3048491 RepID=A0ABT7EL84_9GAMM|nr:protocatechuate 3,4-dioxygenase [Pseudoalteromonas sp. P94(2023)]MDK2595798.1 protocatechuate 3,4-dioxygenase [Pseudoalteromonas sp. P94(2023)]
MKLHRRHFIKNITLGSLVGLIGTHVHARTLTPSEMEGPYYPITPQKDQDADLTKVVGKKGKAKGIAIEIYGQVFDNQGVPLEDTTIDLWQANSYGKYHHPHDNSDAPIDENFQAWAIIQTKAGGHFRFKTVFPGAYPLNASQQRTPHIHLKVSKRGYHSLLTQMYFPDHPLNQKDGLFRSKTRQEQALMTAKTTSKANQYRYDIVLAKV